MPVVSPGVDPQPAAPATRFRAGGSTQGQPAQILVLDDERAIAELLGECSAARLLHHVVPLRSDALELVERHAFDLIISDFRMRR